MTFDRLNGISATDQPATAAASRSCGTIPRKWTFGIFPNARLAVDSASTRDPSGDRNECWPIMSNVQRGRSFAIPAMS